MTQDLSANTTLAHYRIVAKIGAGGMGEVFLAEDSRLRRKVALKLLPPEFTHDKQRLHRFEQEAQTASALNHPNIVTIYEVGAEAGVNFIATEFIDGQTLRQKMRSGLLPLSETLDIAQQVTSALVAAHQAGIVHRDIKPENIMVRPDGLAKVLDFGLAKLSAPATDAIDHEANTIAQGLTRPGIILGTLHYMSPEQVRGQRLDARSDIFSFGAVLYELLTGQGPFVRPTNSDVIAAILAEPTPPLAQVKEGVPPELQRILAKALQKDKTARYQTSQDLLTDLKSLSRELEFKAQMGRTNEMATHVPEPVKAKRFSWVQALALVLLLSLMISAVWWFASRRNTLTEAPVGAALKTAEVVSWRSAPGEIYSIGSFSPDGKRVAFVSTSSGTRNIQVKQTSANAPPVETTKDEFRNDHPVWSPDGEEIAFISRRGNQTGLWRIPYLGGSPTLISTVAGDDTIPMLWSQAGLLYYQTRQNLFALDMKSGQTKQLINFDTATAVDAISISPDEKLVAYITAANDLWQLWLAPASGGTPKLIVNSKAEIRNIVWHADNRRVLYSAVGDGVFQIFVTDIDGHDPVQITFGDKDSLALDVSADGAKILLGSSKEESDVWGVYVAKAEEFAFTSDINAELWPSVAPDGKTVAFQSIRNLSQGNNLFNGAILTKPTDADPPPAQLVADGFLPTWSPDGQQFAFMRIVGSTNNLWTIKATGGEEKQLTTRGLPGVNNTVLPYNRAQASYASWSPDSSKLAYVANTSGASNVWLVAADGSSDTQITNNSDANVILNSPLWSADGKRIAYTSSLNNVVDGKQNYGVWVVEVETKQPKIIQQAENFLRLLGWSAGDRGLLLAATKSKTVSASLTEVGVTEIPLAAGGPRAITTQPSTYIYNIHLSAERQTIAFVSRQDGKDNIWTIPTAGGTARKLTANQDARLYFSSLAWQPDGKVIFFGKQIRYSQLSMITNFK